jgi:O-antigen/teichoic acid export membrane protein
MLTFSFILFVAIFIDNITYSFGKFILGINSSLYNVSIYSITIQLITYFMIFSSIINESFVTEIHKFSIDNQKIVSTLNVISSYKFSFLFFVTSSFFLFGKEFLIFWTNGELENAFYPTLIYMVFLSIPLSQNLIIEYLKAKNIFLFKTVISFIGFIFFVILSVIFTPIYDYYGPIYSIIIVLLFFNIIVMNFYYYKIRISFKEFWKSALLKTIPFTLLILTIGLLLNTYLFLELTIINFVFKVFIISITYSFIFIKFILIKEHKSVFLNLISRFLNVQKLF